MNNQSLLASVQRDLIEGKPLPDVLRECILLGSESGSTALRAWATKELKGYEGPEKVPDYRKVPAQIEADATTGSAIVHGQTIGLSMLPDWVQQHIKNEVTLFQGIGELESLYESARLSSKSPRMSLPEWERIAAAMDREAASENPWQRIYALYWVISPAGIAGVLDAVKTALAEFLAELGAAMPDDQEQPTAEQVTHALHVATGGGSATITIAAPSTSISASGSASVEGVTGGQTGAAGRDLQQTAAYNAAHSKAVQAWLAEYRAALPELDDGVRPLAQQQLDQLGAEVEKDEPQEIVVTTLMGCLRNFAHNAVSSAGTNAGTLALAEVLAHWPLH